MVLESLQGNVTARPRAPDSVNYCDSDSGHKIGHSSGGVKPVQTPDVTV